MTPVSDHKRCTECRQILPIDAFYPQRTKSTKGEQDRYHMASCKPCSEKRRREWVAANKERRREATRLWRIGVRLEVLAAYGGMCACCGESEPKFLSIDHINNDGAAHKRNERISGGHAMNLWLRRNGFPKDGFQCLCHNCNLAKGFYGECPHQQRVAERQLFTDSWAVTAGKQAA